MPEHSHSYISTISRLKTLNLNPSETPLKRCISIGELILLGIGGILGSGVYVLTGSVAKDVAGPAVSISYLIACFPTLLAAICFAEFGARIPRTGSAYIYTYVTLGEMWAFIVGWNFVLEICVGNAASARTVSGYLDMLTRFKIRNFTIDYITGRSIDHPPLSQYPDLVALFLIIIVTLVLSMGINISVKVASIFTCISIGVMLFIVCMGFYLMDKTNWEAQGGFAPYGFSGIAAGAASCVYAYTGFEIITTASEESLNPTKSIPIAICASLTFAVVVYVTVSAALTLMIPYYNINPDASFADAFQQHGLLWAKYAAGIGAVCGVSITLFISTICISKIIYAMAADGLLFTALARIEQCNQVPVFATITCGAFTAILAIFVDTDFLVQCRSIGGLFGYVMISTSVIILRYRPIGNITYENGNTPSNKDIPQLEHNTSLNVANITQNDTFSVGIFRNLKPGMLPGMATILMTMGMFILAAIINFGTDSFKVWKPWLILTLIVLGLFVVLCFAVICKHKQEETRLKFKVGSCVDKTTH
uniref:Cationic amino acid transporter 4-like n=1 Tax=Saccoglossus kowalevskii TaxID=10224 RepID=A0ABM0M279_SACKO|nr:PREDICTED: cationic amino acid transporter 4-like [Saccoglossus kowalevskii]